MVIGVLSKIFDMSNIVGQPIRGPFGRPDKSFRLTKYVNFDWSVSVYSLTTVQWKDKGYWSYDQLNRSRRSMFFGRLPFYPSHRRDLSPHGTGPLFKSAFTTIPVSPQNDSRMHWSVLPE